MILFWKTKRNTFANVLLTSGFKDCPGLQQILGNLSNVSITPAKFGIAHEKLHLQKESGLPFRSFFKGYVKLWGSFCQVGRSNAN